jgi:uncharacterized protein (DUF1684 family)
MSLTHKYTLMADDVRVEMSGKFMVIGMYTPDMTVPQIPFVAPTLTFFQLLEADRPADHMLRVQLQHLESGRAVAQAITNLQVIPGLVLNLPRFANVQFNSAGTYQLTTIVDEGRDPIIHSFNVVLVIPQQQQLRA